MREFSQLLDRLVYTRSRNAKLKLIADYVRETPDPDRGWAMAALTGTLGLPGVKASQIRAIVDERVDPVLFAMSYDFVGDLAETAALLWPKPEGMPEEEPRPPRGEGDGERPRSENGGERSRRGGGRGGERSRR